MSFKLIAIRPLQRCGQKFLKNLQINRIYKLYKDYKFYSDGVLVNDFENDKSSYYPIDNILFESALPKDFFGVNVNVSAIIGKNGSGKSTLINLFVASINQMSIKLQNQGQLKTTAELKSAVEDSDDRIYCEFYYQLEGEFYIVKVEDEEFVIETLEGNIDFDFEKFFYSNVINHSIYGFNSWELGDWIDNLFHKNDSYQIPIVINPKRERKDEGKAGIIDINNENYLLQQRLLSVVLMNEKFTITQNLTVDFINLEFKNSKHFFAYSNDKSQLGANYDDEKKIKSNIYPSLESGFGIKFQNSHRPYHGLALLLKAFKKRFEITSITIPEVQYRLDIYIVHKIIGICEKYVGYGQFIKNDGQEKYTRYSIDSSGFLNKMSESHSHIVLKLRQVINFIKNYHTIWQEYLDEKSMGKLPVSELSKTLLAKRNSNLPLIELLPPAIFSSRLLSKLKVDLLDSISSGEMQLVHSTTAVIYHLGNINSVEADDTIVKYKYVNLVLDEIELYFHPEYQRKFLNRLLDNISKANLDDIKGINILIISHSPFILSDIPSQNVLFLEVNESKEAVPKEFKSDNTFAENIHEILSNGFFLTSTMGEFARSKIQEFLEFEKHTSIDAEFIYKEKREDFAKLVNLVGENYVRNILKNHLEALDKKYLSDENRIDEIQSEINRLEQIKDSLEK